MTLVEELAIQRHVGVRIRAVVATHVAARARRLVLLSSADRGGVLHNLCALHAEHTPHEAGHRTLLCHALTVLTTTIVITSNIVVLASALLGAPTETVRGWARATGRAGRHDDLALLVDEHVELLVVVDVVLERLHLPAASAHCREVADDLGLGKVDGVLVVLTQHNPRLAVPKEVLSELSSLVLGALLVGLVSVLTTGHHLRDVVGVALALRGHRGHDHLLAEALVQFLHEYAHHLARRRRHLRARDPVEARGRQCREVALQERRHGVVAEGHFDQHAKHREGGVAHLKRGMAHKSHRDGLDEGVDLAG
eukprot:PhM_4_TR10714/c0_g1_i1/m.63762